MKEIGSGLDVPKKMFPAPDAWISAFAEANAIVPANPFVEQILVGNAVTKSVSTGEVLWDNLYETRPTPAQVEKVASTIAKTHKAFGVTAKIDDEILVDIWDRAYGHLWVVVHKIGRLSQESGDNQLIGRFDLLNRLYSASTRGVRSPISLVAAREYRQSLNLNAKTGPERFDESLLANLYKEVSHQVKQESEKIKFEEQIQIPTLIVESFTKKIR